MDGNCNDGYNFWCDWCCQQVFYWIWMCIAGEEQNSKAFCSFFDSQNMIWRTILFPGADPDIQTLRSVCTKRGGFTHTWKHGAPPVQPEIQESWQAGITRGRLGHYQISVSVSIITLLSAEWITHFLLSSSSNKDKYLTEISTENQLVAIGKSENVSQIKSQCILHLMS